MKAQGKRDYLSSFNPNFTLAEYGMPKSCVHGLPDNGEVLFAEGPDKAVEFCDRLREKLAEHPDGMRLQNIEISKVQWSTVALELLLSMFQEKSATSMRIKAFRCGLDDQGLETIITWLEATPAEGLPSEIHLSHNQITTAGFQKLVEVLEAKWAELTTKPLPIWLRVEGNKIEDSAIKQLVQDQRAVFCANCGGRNAHVGKAALAFPGFPDQKSQGYQKGYQEHKGKGSWAGWDSAPMMAMAAKAAALKGCRPPQAFAAAGAGSNGKGWQASGWGNQPPAHIPAASRPVTARPLTVTPAAQQQIGWSQTVRATDRSRTPLGREAAQVIQPAQVVQPAQQAEKAKSLPHPWEEQFSDEYKIPYYWNPETGESMWEPPSA